MRKLAPARVSHWDDFLISYRVYMMTGSFHILLFNGTFHVDKYTFASKSLTLRMRYPFQSTGRPISHQSRSQSPRAFWSAPRHEALDQDFRTSVFTAHAWLGLNGV